MLSTAPTWAFALSRFGLGARPGDVARKGDPRDTLRAELKQNGIATIDDAALRPSQIVLADVFAEEKRDNEQKKAALASAKAMMGPMDPQMTSTVAPRADFGAVPAMRPEPKIQEKAFRAEALARFQRAVTAETGFVERLVAFWSNHFCVSIAKGNLDRASAGAFEREAIRPHVLGRFAEMLRAVEQHPAMLSFLDNYQSFGPNSTMAHNRKLGLNENLAREILELHTMGVGAGYSQSDVTQFANVLTGWSVGGRAMRSGDFGAFSFDERAHEPTAATIRGTLYIQDGVAQGEAVLDDLAREPATGIHIALKFARHFVADEPPPALVQNLSNTFRDTDGDLMALAWTLVESEQAWSAPRAKIRNPWELTVAAYRAFPRDLPDIGPVFNSLNLLGQPLWQPAGPNGFSDMAAAWLSPEGMKLRVELAAQFANGVKSGPPPLDLAHEILGPDVSANTLEAMRRAESVPQAYALLLLSPEFQRR